MKYMVIDGEFGDEEYFYDTLENAQLHNTDTIYVVEKVLRRENIQPEYRWVEKSPTNG